MSIESFQIEFPDEALDDLNDRLKCVRWPLEVEDIGWDYGSNLEYMKELVDYWLNEYDWRKEEEKLNQLSHYRAEIDGLKIHYVYEKGKGPNPTPIIITHGWPGSFYEICKLIPLLTDPGKYGGNPDNSFDVIVPSIPGYGFSDQPRRRGMMSLNGISDLWCKLMVDVLDYDRFAAAGGDFGAVITQYLAENYPERLIGIHLTYIGFYVSTESISDLSEAEKHYLQRLQMWTFQEGSYFMIQGTKPQTLAYGLNDSPIGLAAWITEKFHSWTDEDGVTGRISKDELLTNIMIYWITQTIGSSIRTYAEDTPGKMKPIPPVPAAFARFPFDINPPPQEWVERRVNLKQWTNMPRGGHFAAMEEPELLANDIRKFLRDLER